MSDDDYRHERRLNGMLVFLLCFTAGWLAAFAVDSMMGIR